MMTLRHSRYGTCGRIRHCWSYGSLARGLNAATEWALFGTEAGAVSKTQRRTGGAIEAGLVGSDPLLTAQRIVIRAWPSSWSNGKWIIEAYADEYCPVELAVLPASSPCGSAEADDATRLLLSERGARLFSTGQRVFNGTLVAQTLRQRLQAESYYAAFRQAAHSLEGLKESAAKETAARIAEWKKRIESLSQ